jgi:hypothetical protein
MIHTTNLSGAQMKQSIVAIGLGMAVVAASSSGAFARKQPPCAVTGFWTASVAGGAETESFIMTTKKKGTSPDANPECPKSTVTNIKSTTITSTTWNTNITGNKKCTTVITTAATFNTGSCTAASGTITIPGVGSLPLTLTEDTGGVKRTPHRTLSALFEGLK